MPLFRRPDGKLATDIAPTRRIMPYMMRTRTESAVYFSQRLDVTRTLAAIERWNASHERRIGIFHVFLYAAARALAERPRLNRFVSGGRVYQRDDVWISFSAKKALDDDSPLFVVKRRFDAGWNIEDVANAVAGDVREGRSSGKSHVDKELALVLAFPGPIVRLLVGLLRWLDSVNLAPRWFIEPDPMYASLFVANLGSVGLDAAYHHLYEYGTIPLFAAIGRVRQEGESRVCVVKYSFDERVEDGLYCAASLDRLRRYVEEFEG